MEEFDAGAPSAQEWTTFFQSRLLLLGVSLTVVGVIFFVAANWGALPFLFRLGVVVVPLFLSAILSGQLGRESLGGRAAGLFAGGLIGPALALYGQHFQTGADPWELFAGWAVLLVPFALFARFVGTWIFWILLVTLTALLFVSQEYGGQVFFEYSSHIFVGIALFFVAAAATFEVARKGGVTWCQSRWGIRTLMTFGIGTAWAMATKAVIVFRIIEKDDPGGILAALVFCILVAASAVIFYGVVKDSFLVTVALSSFTVWIAIWSCTEVVLLIDNIFVIFFCGAVVLFEVAVLAVVLRLMLKGASDV